MRLLLTSISLTLITFCTITFAEEIPKQLSLIYGKPLKADDLRATFKNELKTTDFWCTNPGRKKFMENYGLKCQIYVVNNVWMSDVYFNHATYSEDMNGIIRESTAIREGKCEEVLKTYFQLTRYFYHGTGPLTARVTNDEISYQIPILKNIELKSNSVSLHMDGEKCSLRYDFIRSDD